MPGFAGYSGLWDMPNARLLPDWNMRVGWSISYPYSCYHAALGLFDVLEINGRVTGIAETNNLDGSGGDYKDKALDIKIKLLSESGRRPALVLGANDIHGTGLFTSRYIAFSKRAGAVDITWGLGQGMMGGQSAADRMETISGDPDDPAMAYIFGHDLDYRWFWGFEWAVNEKLRLTGEYSSISWEKVAGGHEEDSHVNLGLKYNLWRNLLAPDTP